MLGKVECPSIKHALTASSTCGYNFIFSPGERESTINKFIKLMKMKKMLKIENKYKKG